MSVKKAYIEIPIGPEELETAVREYVKKHYHDLISFLPSEEIDVKLLVGAARVPPGVAVQPRCEGAFITITANDQTLDDQPL